MSAAVNTRSDLELRGMSICPECNRRSSTTADWTDPNSMKGFLSKRIHLRQEHWDFLMEALRSYDAKVSARPENDIEPTDIDCIDKQISALVRSLAAC